LEFVKIIGLINKYKKMKIKLTCKDRIYPVYPVNPIKLEELIDESSSLS